MTRLELVQKALAVLDSETVSSIDDTIEATQVADFLDIVYKEIISEYQWPWLRTTAQLELTPVSNEMRIPTGIYNISYIKYDNKDVKYIPYDDMRALLDGRISGGADNVDSIGAVNDQNPVYWTSLDDVNIIFDSYNSALESAKSFCLAYTIPSALTSNTSVPVVPEKFQHVLLYALYASCFYNLKGDDSLGDRYYKLYRQGLVEMKRWAKMVDRAHKTNGAVDYSRPRTLGARYFLWK